MNVLAQKGNTFVLTEKGYRKTPDAVKPERKVGEPVRGFEKTVPVSWVNNGWVEEITTI